MSLQLKIILLCLWSAADIVISAQPGYTLRLVSGKNDYGFVEMSIDGFFHDAYHPICPGRNQQYTDLLSSVICQELGYFDGKSMDMKTESPSLLFWHNTFDVYTDVFVEKPQLKTINAYGNRNWTLAQGIGDFSYCTSSAIAVFCYGEVSLYRGTAGISIDSDLSFGMVVVRTADVTGQNNDAPSKPHYFPYSALDDRGFRVICRELGYEGDTPTAYGPTLQISDSYNTQDGLKPVQKKYKCAGDEQKLSDCPTQDFSDEDDDDNAAAIIKCTTAKEQSGTYRINSDNNMIEVMRKNTWGLTCTGERFTELLCKNMGFSYYRHYTQIDGDIERSAGKLQLMWIYSDSCTQSMTSLTDCKLFDFPTDVSENCDVAFARCYNDEPTYDLSEVPAYRELGHHFILRTKGHMHGILVIDSDDTRHAQFICNQLKYTYGRNYPISRRNTQGFATNYWKATYNSHSSLCKYQQKRKTLMIDDCYEDDWDLISDSGKTPLVNYMTVCYYMVYLEGNGYFGLVSYMYNSPKLDVAYINKDSLSHTEVELICNHIGFRNGGNIYDGYINHQHEFDLYDIVCLDGSQRLEDCTFTKNPTAKSPVAIECTLHSANVEKYFLDTHGIAHIDLNIPKRICYNSQWDFNTTRIFCNNLGFESGSSFSRLQDQFANPVGYESVHCKGTEDDFNKCKRITFTSGSPPCQNVVAVTCYNSESVIDNIRLVDGGNRFGNIMVNTSSFDRYYCPDTFTKEDASTICKHMGYTSGINIKMDPITESKAKWWTVKNSRCTETTHRLEACGGQDWHLVDSRDDKGCRTKTASVYCYSKVQFEKGPYLNYGVIQETVSQRRYSSKSFGDTEANIACREMGFPLGGRVFPAKDSTYKVDGTPISVKCKGIEPSLLDCTQTSGSVDKKFLAAVVCETGDILPSDNTIKIDYDSRLFVAKDGIWYTICADNWMTDGQTTATTVCQQRGSGSGNPTLRHMSSTYATCRTNDYMSYDNLINILCDKRYLGGDNLRYCENNLAVFSGEETLTVSALHYPRPVEGKSTRSSAVNSIASPMLLLTVVNYLVFVI